MMKRLFTELSLLNLNQRINRLRWFTLLFFVVLFIPTSIVFIKGFNQFEQDRLKEYLRHTEKISAKIDKKIFKRVAFLNAISPGQFDYYQTQYSPISKQVTQVRSPLSTLDAFQPHKGHVGYFQIDQQGLFNSPIWPYPVTTDVTKQLSNAQVTPDALKLNNIARSLKEITDKSGELKRITKQLTSITAKRFQLITDVPNYFIFYRIIDTVDQKKIKGYELNRYTYLYSLVVEMMEMIDLDKKIALTLHPKPSNGR
jgi:hypothetical protein